MPTFAIPVAVVPDSLMRNPTVTRQEALALTAYMLSQWKRDVPESYLAPDKIEQKYRALHPLPLTGEQVYGQYCAACHGNGTYSSLGQEIQPLYSGDSRRFSDLNRNSRGISKATSSKDVLAPKCRLGVRTRAGCFPRKSRE